MSMIKIVRCDRLDYAVLAGIWERSVRASHDFLPEEVIVEIRNRLIPEYFPAVEIYAVDVNGVLTGFVGQSGDKIEMLFVDGNQRGHGYGTALLDFAVKRGAVSVDVNEQNPLALEFYLSKGFQVVGRDNTDDSGREYPILHLSL